MCGPKKEDTRIQTLMGLARVLHCPTRWAIIDIIGKGEKSTSRILEELEDRGYRLTRPGLYYHLSELREAGIIEVADYVEEGRGAPTKSWRVAMRKLEIELVPEGEHG
ncbi:MAG: ArsR/SmtB family transcription factor [Methanomassiliicoccales archaeon]